MRDLVILLAIFVLSTIAVPTKHRTPAAVLVLSVITWVTTTIILYH